MELQELIKLIYRKKIYLVIVPLISAAMGFTFRFLSDRIYISESQISTGLTLMDFTGESSVVNPFELSLSFSNLSENMASKTVINRLGYKLLFHDLSNTQAFRSPNFEKLEIERPSADTVELVLNQLKKSIDDYSLVSKTTEIGKYIYSLLEIYEYNEINLLNDVSIQRVGNTDFINIRFASEVPQLSAYVVNEWATGFIEYYNHKKTNRLNESLSILIQILEEKKKLLDESTSKLNRYKSRYIMYSSDTDSDPVGELEKLIREKEGEIRNLNYRLQDVRDKISEKDNSSSFGTRRKIIKLRKELERLSDRLSKDVHNADILDSLEVCRNELQSEMYLHTSSSTDKRELDKLFEEENELELKYKISIVDLQKYNDLYRTEKGTVRSLASTKSSVENIETEVEQSRSDFIAAQDKYNQAKSKLIIGSSSLKVSYYGDVPEDPQSRKTIVFTAFGLIAGGVIVIFMIVGLELIDARIKTPLRFKRKTELEPNGFVENLSEINNDLSLMIGSNKGIGDDKHILPTSFIQSLRKMRFEIQLLKGNVILFTSLRSGSGKSFVLSALAYSLSLVRKKVLIIDTNFRNNSLTTSLGNGSSEGGLKDLILKVDKNGEKDSNEGVQTQNAKLNIVTQTINPYISIIKTFKIQKSPDEVFSSFQFETLIESFKKSYDFIFLEGAALNSYSDSKELSKYVDHMVSVYSVDDEVSGLDKSSLSFLNQKDDIHVLRVLNRINLDDTL